MTSLGAIAEPTNPAPEPADDDPTPQRPRRTLVAMVGGLIVIAMVITWGWSNQRAARSWEHRAVALEDHSATLERDRVTANDQIAQHVTHVAELEDDNAVLVEERDQLYDLALDGRELSDELVACIKTVGAYFVPPAGATASDAETAMRQTCETAISHHIAHASAVGFLVPTTPR